MKIIKNKKIFLFAGGTGGHVIPSVNFGNYLISRGYNCFLLVDKRGKFYTNNFKGTIFLIPSSHFKGNLLFKLKALINLLLGGIKCLFYIVKIKPKNCLFFGSYACFMPLIITVILKTIMKINIYIHEQNSIMGKVNLLFLRYAKNIFTNFEHVINLEEKYLKKMIYVGLPQTSNKFKIKSKIYNKNEKIIIFIYGGSQGSISVIQLLLSLVEKLRINNLQKIKLIIQTPKKIIFSVKKKLNNLKIENEVKDFFYNIDEILNVADIVISRSGAGTINDLINYNIPSILLPLSNSMNNHQLQNAKYLADKECAFIMDENNFNLDVNYKILLELIENDKKRKNIKKILKDINVPHANELMLNKIYDE